MLLCASAPGTAGPQARPLIFYCRCRCRCPCCCFPASAGLQPLLPPAVAQANGKFDSIDSGDEAPLSVSRCCLPALLECMGARPRAFPLINTGDSLCWERALLAGSKPPTASPSRCLSLPLPLPPALPPHWLPQSSTDNFGQVVRELKQRCGVDYVYCWHAMMGYWSGLMPGVRY